MKVLVTGVNGQLGHDVINELVGRGLDAIGSDITPVYGGADDASAVCTAKYMQMDITDAEGVRSRIIFEQPDAVIHCAAWTAVDAAEEPENLGKVKAVNFVGTKNIAKACSELNIPIMYISTDYVFDGQGELPWDPDCRDFRPLNVYGNTKLMGERTIEANTDKFFIVRIAWVFGINGNNFIKTMLKVGKTYDSVRVVCDQIGTPTYTYDLARLLVDMIQTDKYGYYHATNEGGYISWYDFTKEIYRQAGITTTVNPVTTAEYGLSKAARPFNSRLEKKKLVLSGFEPLPDWRDALSRYLEELNRQQ